MWFDRRALRRHRLPPTVRSTTPPLARRPLALRELPTASLLTSLRADLKLRNCLGFRYTLGRDTYGRTVTDTSVSEMVAEVNRVINLWMTFAFDCPASVTIIRV